MQEETKTSGLTVPVSIVIAGALIAVSVIYAVGSKNQPPQAAQVGGEDNVADSAAILKVGERDVVLGDVNAPVTVVEYSDYQCPFCARFFSQVEPEIRDKYIKTGKVKMVYRDFAFLGSESNAAAESAECAKDQGKFWNYHDALFNAEELDGAENNGNLNRDLFVRLAGEVGMDKNQFSTCLDSNKYVETVKKATSDAQSIGVRGTPTTFVDGTPYSGVDPSDPTGQYIRAIEGALSGK